MIAEGRYSRHACRNDQMSLRVGGSFDCGHAIHRLEKLIRLAAADFLTQAFLGFRVGFRFIQSTGEPKPSS